MCWLTWGPSPQKPDRDKVDSSGGLAPPPGGLRETERDDWEEKMRHPRLLTPLRENFRQAALIGNRGHFPQAEAPLGEGWRSEQASASGTSQERRIAVRDYPDSRNGETCFLLCFCTAFELIEGFWLSGGVSLGSWKCLPTFTMKEFKIFI